MLNTRFKLLKEVTRDDFWSYKKELGVEMVTHEGLDNSYRLNEYIIQRAGDNELTVYLGVSQTVKRVQYIYNSIFGGSDKSTLLYSSSEVKVLTLDSTVLDYQVELKSTLRNQYLHELKPMINRFRDIDEVRRYDEKLGKSYKFIVNDHVPVRLILYKLISNDMYLSYLKEKEDNYEMVLLDPVWANKKSTHKSIERFKDVVGYLQSFNVQEYLTNKPWRSIEKRVVNKGLTISLSRTSMIVISKIVSIDYLKQLFSFSSICKIEETVVGDSERMLMQPILDVVHLNKGTVVFVHLPRFYEVFDIVTASERSKVLRFVVDDVSNSYCYELAENGKVKVVGIDLDGEENKVESSLLMNFETEDSESVIRMLFKMVANIELAEISTDQRVKRYIIDC